MKFLYKLVLMSSLLIVVINSVVAKPTKEKTKNEKENEIENKILDDFINRKSYIRDGLTSTPSPFRNLIISEEIRIKRAKEEADKQKKIEEENKRNGPEILEALNPKENGNKPIDEEVEKQKILILVNKELLRVDGFTKKRQYTSAEQLLSKLEQLLAKYNADDTKKKVKLRKKEVLQEHNDWTIINGILNGLTVDAMFTAKGKRKIALINSSAIEEGESLNDILNKNKISPIILSFVSTNSITVKFKKFTLKKDLIDNDL